MSSVSFKILQVVCKRLMPRTERVTLNVMNHKHSGILVAAVIIVIN
ncbi:hypothetical protein CZ787_11640 [Halomonas citrativorans]|uniref:Uncharacterized protein n=1 Tax=Halomonas citrativorans TaxID=2742612 RepID=A0A1R4I1Y0_9GAMM|nr:hypothetical protein CZ787_11640 [Halomonas citrativorans]